MIPRVFLSYAHADIHRLKDIIFMLDELKREEMIEFFHDGDLRAGELWDDEIAEHLSSATHFLVAISDDYVKSKYVGTNELPLIRNRVDCGDAVAFPLIISGSGWQIFLKGNRAGFLRKEH